ncbi:MAG: hypothetical protein WC530_07820, partial [Candidatus Omnitrophota bacterium]
MVSGSRKKRKPVPSKSRWPLAPNAPARLRQEFDTPVRSVPAQDAIEKILRFEEGNPFKILGPHPARNGRGVVIRAFLPRASKAWVQPLEGNRERKPMEKIHPGGFFQAVFEKVGRIFPYKIGTCDENGFLHEAEDPYAFFPDQLSDYDLYLIGEGTHHRSYEKFGSHLL